MNRLSSDSITVALKTNLIGTTGEIKDAIIMDRQKHLSLDIKRTLFFCMFTVFSHFT